MYTSELHQNRTRRWDILAPFASDKQKTILLTITIASVIIWYFMDLTYQHDWYALNEVIYLKDYSIGELLHESSGVLETFMTWWVIAKFCAGLKIIGKIIRFTALFKMTCMVVGLVFFLFVNPFGINLARTTYYYWEFAAYLFNCFIFILLPTLIRKTFLVRK